MARDVDGLDLVVSDGFTRYLVVDVLHGTNHVATEMVEDWALSGDLDHDPKTTGRLRFAHASVAGESWVPDGARGVVSPFQTTLLLTEVISVGTFERRVQLGLFDVVAVPSAVDVTATVGARWVETTGAVDDLFPPDDVFPVVDEFPGEIVYVRGDMVGGRKVVVATILEVEVESLDGRVLGDSFESPRTPLSTALDEWRAVGILPVSVDAEDVALPAAAIPAEDGARLNDVQDCARLLGGVPVVDSFGQWTLADDNTPTVTLRLGDGGTVVELTSQLTLDGFANVVIGNYEDESGNPIRSRWVASGLLAPDIMGRRIVHFRTSDKVRTQADADADTASVGERLTSREVEWQITCVYNPIVELGDHVSVPGTDVSGVAARVAVSGDATMTVVVRGRRAL